MKRKKIKLIPIKEEKEPNIPSLPKKENIYTKSMYNIPSCCKNCPNHPINGGSGFCNCTLPYFDRKWWIIT